jgi:hypothetical protein
MEGSNVSATSVARRDRCLGLPPTLVDIERGADGPHDGCPMPKRYPSSSSVTWSLCGTCLSGLTPAQVADAFEISKHSVQRWFKQDDIDRVDSGLPDPVADRLGGHAGILGCLADRQAGSFDEPDRLLLESRGCTAMPSSAPSSVGGPSQTGGLCRTPVSSRLPAAKLDSAAKRTGVTGRA